MNVISNIRNTSKTKTNLQTAQPQAMPTYKTLDEMGFDDLYVEVREQEFPYAKEAIAKGVHWLRQLHRQPKKTSRPTREKLPEIPFWKHPGVMRRIIQ
jgi:hypothetical protein